MNPYTAPETRIAEEVEEVEVHRAREVRARHAASERSIRLVSWFNMIIAVALGGPTSVVFVIVISGFTPKGTQPMPGGRPMFFVAALGMSIAALNFWIWYGLRRFLPWARRLDLGLSVLVLMNVVRLVVMGLERGAPPGYWLGSVSIPCILGSLILYVLTTANVRTVFKADYQHALAITRYDRR